MAAWEITRPILYCSAVCKPSRVYIRDIVTLVAITVNPLIGRAWLGHRPSPTR
jgi:hypothetical protein